MINYSSTPSFEGDRKKAEDAKTDMQESKKDDNATNREEGDGFRELSQGIDGLLDDEDTVMEDPNNIAICSSVGTGTHHTTSNNVPVWALGIRIQQRKP